MKLTSLSFMIKEDIPLYGGKLPCPLFTENSSISDGDTSNSYLLTLHNHSGTHIDAPKHFIDSGRPIYDYSIEELTFQNPVLVECPVGASSLIFPSDLEYACQSLSECDCLLLRTGFEKYRNQDRYIFENPGISSETIFWLRRNYPEIRCIGIDCISISSFSHREEGRFAHRAAFQTSVEMGPPLLLIEDMKLSVVENGSFFTLIVVPWQIEGIDSAPCNVIACKDC